MGSGRRHTRRSWRGKSLQCGGTALWSDCGNKRVITKCSQPHVLIELTCRTEYGRSSYARADAQGLQPRSLLGHEAHIYSRLTFDNYYPKWQVPQLVRLIEASCCRLKGPLLFADWTIVDSGLSIGPLQLIA